MSATKLFLPEDSVIIHFWIYPKQLFYVIHLQDVGIEKSLNKNILIKLLKVISEDEWKGFEKFATSPFFNEGRNYLPLLKILKKFHPEFDSPDFTKEKIYKKLYPRKEYKDSVLNSMFSRLYNIGEEYMIHIALKKDANFLKKRLIIKELRQRGVMLKLNKEIEEQLKYFEKKKFNTADFKSMFETHVELNRLNQVSNKSEIFYKSIYELIKYTSYAFLFELNMYLSSIFSLKNYWKEDFNKSFLFRIFELVNHKEIHEVLKAEDYKSYVPIKLTHLSYLATSHPENDDYYFEMKDLFVKETGNFETGFKEAMLTNLSSICSMKMLLGRSDFKSEAFEIRKLILAQDKEQLSNEYMKIGDFRSYFLDALNLEQFEWAREFFEKNISRVHPEFREDALNYCKAWFAYEDKEYDKAIEFANKITINQITFKLDSKNIISRAFYETNSTEPLLSLLNSYIQLINNSGSKNKQYLHRQRNFVKYLRKLIMIKQRSKDQQIELDVLAENIKNENVSARSWLLKKIAQK